MITIGIKIKITVRCVVGLNIFYSQDRDWVQHKTMLAVPSLGQVVHVFPLIEAPLTLPPAGSTAAPNTDTDTVTG